MLFAGSQRPNRAVVTPMKTEQLEGTVPLPGCWGLLLCCTTGPGCFQGEAAAFALPKGKEGIRDQSS